MPRVYHYHEGVELEDKHRLMALLRFHDAREELDERSLLLSALRFRLAYRKCKCFFRVFRRHTMPGNLIPSLAQDMLDFQWKLERDWVGGLYKYSTQFARNKSYLLKSVDCMCRAVARALFPDDAEIAEAISSNERYWESRPMPSVGHRKPGPKKGSKRKTTK